MPLLLSAIVASLVMHHSLETSALDMLASLGESEPKLGVTLLLVVLYDSNILRDTFKRSTDVVVSILVYFFWCNSILVCIVKYNNY